jgi:hypothetical protein
MIKRIVTYFAAYKFMCTRYMYNSDSIYSFTGKQRFESINCIHNFHNYIWLSRCISPSDEGNLQNDQYTSNICQVV